MGHFLCNCIHGRRLEMIFAIIIVAQLHLSDGYQVQTSSNIVSFGAQVSPSIRYSLDVDVSNFVLLLVPITTSGTLFAFAAVFNNTAPFTVMLWRPVQSNKYQVVWKMTVTPSSLNTTEYIFVESSFTQPCANVQNGDWVGLYSKAKPYPVARVFDADSATSQFSAPWPSIPPPELLHTVEIVTATLPYPITYLFSVFVLATGQTTPASTTTTLHTASTDSWIDDGSNSTRVDWNNSSSDVPSTMIPTTTMTTATATTTTTTAVSSTTLQVTNAAANAQCVPGLVPLLPSPMTTTTTSPPIIYGVNGSTGPVGWTGNQGPRGPPGFTGDLGLTGMASNESGETGPLGPTGLIGPDGFNSTEQGVQGLNGTTGPDGEFGDYGMIGLNGSMGVDGPLGKNMTIFRYKDGHYDIVGSDPSTGKNTQSPSFWQQTIAIIGIYIWLAVASFVALIAFIFLIVICCTDCILRKTVQIERRYGMLD